MSIDIAREAAIRNYYMHNFHWCVNQIQYGGPNNGGFVPVMEAEGVVNDIFLKYLDKPETFNAKYVYNRLMSRRRDWLKCYFREVEAKKLYLNTVQAAEEQKDVYNPEEMSSQIEMAQIIEREIEDVKNEKHKEILVRHLIEGEPIIEIDILEYDARKRMALRFKQLMIDKYGGDSVDI